MKNEKIKNLFNEINTPKYDILEGVYSAMENKKYKRPRFSVVAVVAALMVILTAGVVVAAYYGTGGFGRLRSIVGEEHAENLTPVEEILDTESFAAPFIPGFSPTNDEFRIEIVAINIGENREYMYLYATLEDLTGDRADCDFFSLSFAVHTPDNEHLYNFDTSVDWAGLFGGFRANDVIHRDENGTLTLRTRQNLYGREDVFANNQVTITFTELTYNETGYIDDHIIDFDFATIPLNAPYQRTIFEGGSWSNAVQFCEYENEYVFYMLEPFQLDMPLGLDGIRTRISSIGIINGNLHIQTYQPRPSYIAFSALRLQNVNAQQDERELEELLRGNEERLQTLDETEHDIDAIRQFMEARIRQRFNQGDSSYSTIFNLSPEGRAYNYTFSREAKHPINRGHFSISDFQEYVWTNINVNDLENLQLTGIFSDNYSVWLDWTTSFFVN
jgi:hypothetical protein